MANKAKMFYDQASALVAPDESLGPSLAAKKVNINAYKDAPANGEAPTLVIAAPYKPSPKDMLNGGGYGSRPGEKRIDTSFPEYNAKPVALPPAPPVPDPKVPVQNQMRAEGQEAEHNDEVERQATNQNMINMQQQQMMQQTPMSAFPPSMHAEGGKLDPNRVNIVGEEGPEEIVGDQVIPMNHGQERNPMTQLPEEKQEGAPADFEGPVYPNPGHMKVQEDTEKPAIDQKAPMNMQNAPGGQAAGQPAAVQEASFKPKEPIVPHDNGMMKPSKLAPPAGPQQVEQVAPPDPNQVIADQHAKTMKAKLDAASKGDLVGMGAAIIAGNALPKPPIPGAAEGGVVPDVNLGQGGGAMPNYTGKERVGAGTPGEMQVKKQYQDQLDDLDHKILTASKIHTPEGKQELGYLQSEKAVLQKMNPLGSAGNKPGLLGKIEHGLGAVGNAVGDALIPNVMPNIPGTQANLNAQNEEGAANVEQGSSDALRAAQADKAQQTPPVKPQDQLAQEKLNAQTKLGQLTQQLQDPNTTPEQKAALQQQAEQIYSTNPEFRPKQEDQGKQPVGDDGAKQHAQQLDTVAQAAGFTPQQSAAQHKAFDVKPTDSAVIAEKKMNEAKSVAQLDSSRRDRETARLAAENNRRDAKANKTDEQDDKRMDKSYQYNQTRLDKARKPVDDLAVRMGRLKETLAQGTPQADALVAPELLTVMAGGQGSGLRMNEAEISRLIGGRSHWETLKADINKWSLDPKTANTITPEQRKEIHALVDAVSRRAQRSVDIMDDANGRLTEAKSPEEHRKVLNDVQAKMSRATAGKVKVQIPGQPAADISIDNLDAFKQKYPNATIE